MAQPALKLEQETAASTDVNIVDQVRADPAIVLTDEDKLNAFLVAIEAQAFKDAGNDASTSVGRDRIKSAAHGIARLKTAIDDAGKAQTEEWRRQTAEVNARRNVVKPALQGIQDRVRQPVTEWENREATRKAEADLIIEKLRSAATVTIADTADVVKARLEEVRGLNLNDEVLGARTQMAVDLRDDAVKALGDAIIHLERVEAELAEAARLRAEQEKRDAQEAERRRAEEARLAEERRAQEERDRIERERADAARRAQEEAEQRQRDELQRVEREKQAEIDAANERARAAEAEARRVAEQAEAARQEEEKRRAAEAEDQRRREADQAHRTAVKTAAKQAMMTCGADEETARKIVTAIQAGEIPHVTLSF